MGKVAAELTSAHFQYFNDDGSETGHSQVFAVDTDGDLDTSKKYRMRCGHLETAAGETINTALQWEYSTNDTDWVSISTTAAPIQAEASAETGWTITPGDDCTQQLDAGGTYHSDNDGYTESGQAGGGVLDITANEKYETELCFGIPFNQVSDNDTLFLRATASGEVNVYTTYPAPTVNLVVPGDQVAFRGYEDDNVEGSRTPIANQNVDFDWALDTNLIMRFEIDWDGELINSVQYNLQQNINAGGWTDVTAASTGARLTDSANFVSGDNTTNQLTAGQGSFVVGEHVEASGTPGHTDWTGAGNHTEWVFCVQLRSADLSSGDDIQFRVQTDGYDLGTYTATPTVSVPVAGLTVNLDHIASGEQLYALQVNQNVDLDFIDESALYSPQVNLNVDLDAIPTGETLYPLQADLNVDLDHLNAGAIYPLTIAVDQTINLDFIDESALYELTVNQNVDLAAIASGETMYAFQVDQNVDLSLIDDSALYALQVNQNVDLAAIDESALYAFTVSLGGAPQTVNLDHIASGETLYTLQVNQNVDLAYIASGEQLYAPQANQNVDLAYLDDSALYTFTISLAGGAQTVNLAYIDDSALHELTVIQNVDLAHIDAGTLYALQVNLNVLLDYIASGEALSAFQVNLNVLLEAIASGEALYPFTLSFDQAIALAYIASGESLYALAVSLGTLTPTIPIIEPAANTNALMPAAKVQAGIVEPDIFVHDPVDINARTPAAKVQTETIKETIN